MTVLVTGASGFLGSHLCQRLLQDGYDVIGLVHCELLGTKNKKIKLHIGDITDINSLTGVFHDNNIDTVFHLAAALPYHKNPQYHKVNIRGSHNILSLCGQYKVRQFVFASSMSVYATPRYLPVDENHPLSPDNTYGRSKLKIERIIHSYAIPSYVIIRYSGMYGVGQKSGRAIDTFVRQALENKPLTVDGNGSQSSDFVYVEDAVEGTLLAWGNQGTYNIGSGQEMNLLGLAKLIVEFTGSKSEIILGGKSVDRPFRFVADISKAHRELGYNPKSIESGIRAYIDKVSE